MKTIIEDIRCFIEIEKAAVKENSGRQRVYPRPKIPVLDFTEIAYALTPQTKLKVRVMLDTGCDLSLVSPRVTEELDEALRKEARADQSLPSVLPIERRIKFYERCVKEDDQSLPDYRDDDDELLYAPAFDLLLFFTEHDSYRSGYGFLQPFGWNFEDFDIWLGRDILNQLVFSFNGPGETVSISDPAKS
ncbi:MAG TPA: hypothetical protein VIW80_22560 [Pyrinomonadaceae bacterium]|jgi:hypothetical protein